MLVVPSNIGSPTTITIVFNAATFAVDLTTVTAVTYNVTRRDGTGTSWDATIVSATPGELVTQYEFTGSGEITVTGAYYISASLTVPGGNVTAATVTLFVTTPNGLQPRTEETAWVLETVPVLSLGGYKSAWVNISADDSPYSAIPTSPNIAVDLTSGSVSITLWEAVDGDHVIISSSHRTASLTQFLTLNAADGQLLPLVGDGFTSTVMRTDPGFCINYKYDSEVSAWLPWAIDPTIAVAAALGGDLSGTTAVAFVEGIHGDPITSDAPSTGQALIFDGVSWDPGSDFGAQPITTTSYVGFPGALAVPTTGKLRFGFSSGDLLYAKSPADSDVPIVVYIPGEVVIGDTSWNTVTVRTYTAGGNFKIIDGSGSPYLIIQVGSSARAYFVNTPVSGYSVYSSAYREYRKDISFTSDADKVVTAAEFEAVIHTITSTVTLTLPRKYQLPSQDGATFTLHNNTTGGQAITATRADGGGTGVSIANGSRKEVYYDATNDDYFWKNG